MNAAKRPKEDWTLTLEKLHRFIVRRNESELQTNLQFGIDLYAEGIKLEDLGKPRRVGQDHNRNGVFEWVTPFGRLIEERGKLRLET